MDIISVLSIYLVGVGIGIVLSLSYYNIVANKALNLLDRAQQHHDRAEHALSETKKFRKQIEIDRRVIEAGLAKLKEQRNA